MLKLQSLILILGFGILSCGDSEATAQAARADCDAFIEAFCEKVDSCVEGDAFEDCKALVRQDLNCGAAVETTSQYTQCRSDIEEVTCAAIDGPPASCQGVIVVE